MKLNKTAPTSAKHRLLDNATKNGSLEGLMILGSSLGTGTGLGLLDTTLRDAIQSGVW